MSRVGKLPVAIPSGVEVNLTEKEINVKGSLGQLSAQLNRLVNVTKENDSVVVQPANDSREARALWGTYRSNIQNLVEGVSKGFTKGLELRGVGYRAAVQGEYLNLALGYSHDIRYAIPEGITIKVEKQTAIEITGADKQKVGQVASEIRALRKPEPYKGKGVRYADEYVHMKEGKKK